MSLPSVVGGGDQHCVYAAPFRNHNHAELFRPDAKWLLYPRCQSNGLSRILYLSNGSVYGWIPHTLCICLEAENVSFWEASPARGISYHHNTLYALQSSNYAPPLLLSQAGLHKSDRLHQHPAFLQSKSPSESPSHNQMVEKVRSPQQY